MVTNGYRSVTVNVRKICAVDSSPKKVQLQLLGGKLFLLALSTSKRTRL
jgi:hypothetical protein